MFVETLWFAAPSFSPTEVALKQAELDEIYDMLCNGDAVEGWGHSMHNEFVTVFNSEGMLWNRDHETMVWTAERMPLCQRTDRH